MITNITPTILRQAVNELTADGVSLDVIAAGVGLHACTMRVWLRPASDFPHIDAALERWLSIVDVDALPRGAKSAPIRTSVTPSPKPTYRNPVSRKGPHRKAEPIPGHKHCARCDALTPVMEMTSTHTYCLTCNRVIKAASQKRVAERRKASAC